MRCSFVWLTLAALAGACWGGISVAATVPGTSWIYPYLDELRLRGDRPAFFVLTGPYARTDVAAWLDASGGDALAASPRVEWLGRMLRAEMSPESGALGGEDLMITCESVVSSRFQSDRRVSPQATLAFGARARQGLDMWGLLRASANGAAQHKTETKPWHEHWRASFDYGGVGYRRGPVAVFVGRDEIWWGLSPLGGLLFSGSAPSMDMVKLSVRAGGFSFTSFHSRLRRGEGDPWGSGVRRYVAGHRADLVAWKTFNFSLSEVIVYGGEGRALELGYLNPLAPLYAEQWNSGEEDNVLAACDCAVLLPGRAEVRCEVVVDDLQVDDGSEPNEVAVGLDLRAVNPLCREISLVGCSYRLATNRTYGHKVAWNRFTHEGAVMGYPGGPDGDRFEAWASLALSDPYLVTLGYRLARQGEGRAADSQLEPAKSLRFPSGVVEKAHTVAAEVAWRPSWPLRVRARAEWSKVANAGNVADDDDQSVTASLWIEYAVRSAGPLKVGGDDE